MPASADEPMPRAIAPMLARPSKALPTDDRRWAYEFKWDGWRALIYVEDGRVRIASRNQIDLTNRYPELERLGQALAGHRVVLDGEIVAFDAAGRPSFERLQQRAGLEGGRASRADPTIAIAYVAFDLLYVDGRSLLRSLYPERRQALETLSLAGERWMVPPGSVGAGASMLDAARHHGMEGVIAKRLDSRYEAGERTGAWLKIKLPRRHAFVIGGWVPGEAGLRGSLGALVVGYYEDGRLSCVGSVGTGFSEVLRRQLMSRLEAIGRATTPFHGGQAPPTTRFVDPRLVCEVEFTEMTARGRQLRHPSYKGLRADLAPEAVTLAEWARPSADPPGG